MQKKLIWIVSLLAIGMVLLLLAYSSWRAAPRFEIKPERALGEVVAEETAKLLAQGGQVLVISGAGDALLEAQVKGFEAAIEKRPLLKMAGVERLKPVDPLLRTRSPGSPPYAPREFSRALQAHGQVDALVSFIGLPAEELPEWPGMRQRGCKGVVVFNTMASPEVIRALEQRRVNVAIVARDEVVAAETAPKTDRELFDQYYVIATPR
jgi:hypothetical protein